MRKFRQNKLWRDKAIEKLERRGSRIHWRRLDHNDFKTALLSKLVEEAKEVASSATRHEMVTELADLLEVIEAISQLCEISEREIREIKEKKFAEKGGFDGRKFVDFAEHPGGSGAEYYCLQRIS